MKSCGHIGRFASLLLFRVAHHFVKKHYNDKSYPDMHVLKEAEQCLSHKLKPTRTHGGIGLKKIIENNYSKICMSPGSEKDHRE